MRIWAQFLFILISILGQTWQAQSEQLERSSFQTEFERKISDRLKAVLEPILGQQNYYFNYKVEIQPSARPDQPVFFSKLGFTQSLPQNEIMRMSDFVKTVKNIDVKVSYSSEMKSVKVENLKSTVEQTLTSIGNFKTQVQIDTFDPAPTQKLSWISQLPWTPIAILIGGLLMSWAFFTIGSAMTKIPQALSNQSNPSPNVFNEEKQIKQSPELVKQSQSNSTSKTGMQQWNEYLVDESETAKQFLVELSHSSQENDDVIINYLLKHSSLPALKSLVQDLPKENLKKIYKTVSAEPENRSDLTADQLLQKRIFHFTVNQFLDHDQLLKKIHDFTIEECVLVTKAEPSMLTLFAQHFSSVQMEKIFANLDPSHLVEFFNHENNQKDWSQLVQKARNLVDQNRSKKQELSDSSQLKVLLAASHVDEEKEQIIYQMALGKMNSTEVLFAANQNFPQFLVNQLPGTIMKPVLNSYPVRDRAKIFATLNPEKRKYFLNFFKNDGKSFEILEMELEEFLSSPQRMSEILKVKSILQKDFIARIRKYIFQSSENQHQAQKIIEQWISSAELQYDRSA